MQENGTTSLLINVKDSSLFRSKNQGNRLVSSEI